MKLCIIKKLQKQLKLLLSSVSIIESCPSYNIRVLLYYTMKQQHAMLLQHIPVTIVLVDVFFNAAVNGHLELTLLKGRQRFDAISTSNLEVFNIWIGESSPFFIFGHGESSPNNISSTVNLERRCVLLFYYFLYLKVNLNLEKKSLVNLHPTLFLWW